MSVSIFTDVNRNAAMLVCDEPNYALGPVMVADDVNEAVELLEAFVEALGTPADELPTWALVTEWTGFLMAFHGTFIDQGEQPAPPVELADPHAQGHERNGDIPDSVGPETPPAGAVDEPDPLADPGASPHPDEAQDDSQEPVAPAPDDEDEDLELDMRERLADVPGGTPAQRGEAECWNCGGSGEVDIAGTPQTCGVCEGAGRIASAV